MFTSFSEDIIALRWPKPRTIAYIKTYFTANEKLPITTLPQNHQQQVNYAFVQYIYYIMHNYWQINKF